MKTALVTVALLAVLGASAAQACQDHKETSCRSYCVDSTTYTKCR
jgi:hypothetical protein